jgi:outer membrane lipoprotein SlyB
VQVTQAPVAKPVCASCGVVETVIETEKPGEGSGLGVAGGALGGAVIGKQFGNGGGRDALTILGAIGGAIAGHQVEKKVRATKVYEVRVRMEDGSIRSVNQATAPTWRSGDRVRLDGGNISLDS